MDIVGHRKIFYAVSGILVAASITALAVLGLNLGIDFTGGSLIEIEFQDERPGLAAIREALRPLDLGELKLQPTDERGLLIRLRHIDEPTHQEILKRTSHLSPVTEKRFDTIGPTIGLELRRKSLLAISLVVFLILLYVAWAFRKVVRLAPGGVEGPRAWQYGLATIIALLHDVLIPTGLFSFLGIIRGYEADTLFVTALLTILGFSVHDTIVVFDRIRENLKRQESPDFAGMVNVSVNQTLTRSINTSLTVLLAVLAIYLLGGEGTRLFAFTLGAGIIIGTYSSIFIASPLLVTWHQHNAKNKK